MTMTEMRNLRMREKLLSGEALAVDTCGIADVDGVILLDENITEATIEGMDLCIKGTEQWIHSVGQRADGRLLAAIDNRFYMNPGYRCLWLR